MGLLILVVLLLVIPVFIGSMFSHVDKKQGDLLFGWIGGQFLLWAGFQVLCVPLILKERSFSDLTVLYRLYIVLLGLLALAVGIRRRAAKMFRRRVRPSGKGRRSFSEVLFWLLYWGLLLLQLVQAVRLTYADGDDSFYVAISSITQDSDTMYQKLPYTGGATVLDGRHGLAPFPIWVAFLARSSGIPAVTVAHVILPAVLISMTYGIFYLIGRRLFPERDGRLPLFLLFAELLVIFGDYSFYTAENFMIARSRQGKAALGSIVIPFLVFLLLLLLEKMQEKEKLPAAYFLLLAAAIVTGCLCSTLGALLVCVPVGIVGLMGSLYYKRPGILPPVAACCVPCLIYIFLYLIVE